MDVAHENMHTRFVIRSGAKCVTSGAAIAGELIFGYGQRTPAGNVFPSTLVELKSTSVSVESQLASYRSGWAFSCGPSWYPDASAARLYLSVLEEESHDHTLA